MLPKMNCQKLPVVLPKKNRKVSRSLDELGIQIEDVLQVASTEKSQDPKVMEP